MMEWMSKLAETDLKVRYVQTLITQSLVRISAKMVVSQGPSVLFTEDKIVLEKPLNCPWKKSEVFIYCINYGFHFWFRSGGFHRSKSFSDNSFGRNPPTFCHAGSFDS